MEKNGKEGQEGTGASGSGGQPKGNPVRVNGVRPTPVTSDQADPRQIFRSVIRGQGQGGQPSVVRNPRAEPSQGPGRVFEPRVMDPVRVRLDRGGCRGAGYNPLAPPFHPRQPAFDPYPGEPFELRRLNLTPKVTWPVSVKCICKREAWFTYCEVCGSVYARKRKKTVCPDHPKTMYLLLDLERCTSCDAEAHNLKEIPLKKNT